MPKCNCGAKHTSSPNIHSHWCKVIKETSAIVLSNYGMMSFKKIADNKVGITYKPEDMDFGEFDYSYRHGQFKSGIYKESVHAKEFRSTVLQCIDFFVDSINDDRIPAWRAETAKARKEWEDKQIELPPPIDHLELE